MQLHQSGITSKGQDRFPAKQWQKLSLRPGDVLVYELDHDEVRVRKQAPRPHAWRTFEPYRRR